MPGYDWRDSSGDVDASSSGYNYNTGTSHGVSNNSSSSGSSNNYYSNPDAGYDDSWESEVQTGANNVYANLKDTYTPPEKTYGPGTATPGETGYAFTKANPAILKGIDPKTLEFFGYKGGPNIPVELLKMIMEGSIMGGPEAGNVAGPTYSDIEKARLGENPKYEAFQSFYDRIMQQSNLIDITQSGGGGGGGRGGRGYGYGYGYGSGNFRYGGGLDRLRYAHPFKNKNNLGSEIASAIANRTSSPPINQFLFTQMLRRMPGGGITELV
jgi:hypothetical protein|tara:strand:- start:123 stop:929 length:807 start_codon:yes stop_codon:yes gene_type:complete